MDFEAALKAAWSESSPPLKCAKVMTLTQQPLPFDNPHSRPWAFPDPPAASEVGRPARPLHTTTQALPRRRPSTGKGHAALLHAIAHIEFNAINLALDCVLRFGGLAPDFYTGWLRVAQEEAVHFGLVCERLAALGHEYGDFPAHDGLWQMAIRTADDPLERMALVPRVFEARGLDATPLIITKLKKIADQPSIDVLERILQDEVGHVALGDRWFRHLCHARQLDPETHYITLMEAFNAPFPRPPLNEAARLQAGFSAHELKTLVAKRQQPRSVSADAWQ